MYKNKQEYLSYQKAWRAKHKDYIKKKNKEWKAKNLKYNTRWAQKNPAKHKLATSRKHAKMFGYAPLSCPESVLAEHLEKYAGVCHCCGTKTLRFKVDHDHKTGEFRGLLCNKCNTALYVLEDVALHEMLATYLKRTK